MPSETPVLDIANLRVKFAVGEHFLDAVAGVSFTIGDGECVAVIGESGSGKSVSAGTVMGLVDSPPALITADRLHFCGQDLTAMSPGQRRKLYGSRIAMVFQDALAHLNPVYSIGWQVAEMCRIHGLGQKQAKSRAIDLLERVGIPDPHRRYGDYPHQFSGGQRQRVLIAMAIAMRPKLLIADEPTTALDVTVQAQILDLLRELRAETGMSMMMITHDLGVAADIADRVVVMKTGHVMETSGVTDILTNPKSEYTRLLLDSRPKPVDRSRPLREPVFEVAGLTLHHPVRDGWTGRTTSVVRAVDGVDFSMRQGEILGVVGESGSGKSSIARMMLLLEKPSAGSVRFEGRDITKLGGRALRDYRKSVQSVFQDPYSSLNPRKTIFSVLSEPWQLNPGIELKGEWRRRAGELLEQVGLFQRDLDRYPSEFSGGQRQRIAIARALALRPKVVICDEAVSALDMTIQAQVIDLLVDLRKKLGLSLLFIAHDLKLIEDFADRVLVMQRGKIVEQGDVRQVFSDPAHDYTRLLLAASPDANPAVQAQRRERLRAMPGFRKEVQA